jgi:hypothetical protein
VTAEDPRSEASARRRRVEPEARARASYGIERDRQMYWGLLIGAPLGGGVWGGSIIVRADGPDRVVLGVVVILASLAVAAYGLRKLLALRGKGYPMLRQLRDELPLTRPELRALVFVTAAMAVMCWVGSALGSGVTSRVLAVAFTVWFVVAASRLVRGPRRADRR